MNTPKSEHEPPEDGAPDLTSLLAVGALTLATIGVVQGTVFYSAFNVNIFDYASATDFVGFAFRSPLTIVIVFVAALPIYYLWKKSLIRAIAMVTVATIVSAFYSSFDADSVKLGKGRILANIPCVVLLSTEFGKQLGQSDQADPQGSSIGATTPLGAAGDFFLFYEYSGKRTHIAQKDNVLGVSCSSRKAP